MPISMVIAWLDFNVFDTDLAIRKLEERYGDLEEAGFELMASVNGDKLFHRPLPYTGNQQEVGEWEEIDL